MDTECSKGDIVVRNFEDYDILNFPGWLTTMA